MAGIVCRPGLDSRHSFPVAAAGVDAARDHGIDVVTVSSRDPITDPAKLAHLEYESLIPLYELRIEEEPEDIQAMHWLGYAYTHVGRYEDGLDLDRRLCRLLPEDGMVRYNLACSLSLLGRVDEAFDVLYRAVDLGYDDAEHLRADPDLASVRRDDRFPELLKRIRDGA
jgi:tetratricopeptide (TPR) repeat protein